MILSTTIKIQISNNGKYWAEKGHKNTKQGTVIEVMVSDLPKNSNKKVKFICDDCKKEDERQLQLLNRCELHRCYNCARKYIGMTMDKTIITNLGKMSKGEIHYRWNPNKTELRKYTNKVRYMSEKTYKLYKKIINPNDHVRGRCGVPGAYQLDHKKSVKDCFLDGLSEEEAGSIGNLQMLSWEDNRQKW